MRGVHKAYGDLHVLTGLGRGVERGDVVVVIRPSDGGKSTSSGASTRWEGESGLI